jgi:hypothetical protein
MNLQHASIGAIEPGEQEQPVTDPDVCQRSLHRRSNTSAAGGAPSSPCLGASSRFCSVDSTRPMGLTENSMATSSFH